VFQPAAAPADTDAAHVLAGRRLDGAVPSSRLSPQGARAHGISQPCAKLITGVTLTKVSRELNSGVNNAAAQATARLFLIREQLRPQ